MRSPPVSLPASILLSLSFFWSHSSLIIFSTFHSFYGYTLLTVLELFNSEWNKEKIGCVWWLVVWRSWLWRNVVQHRVISAYTTGWWVTGRIVVSLPAAGWGASHPLQWTLLSLVRQVNNFLDPDYLYLCCLQNFSIAYRVSAFHASEQCSVRTKFAVNHVTYLLNVRIRVREVSCAQNIVIFTRRINELVQIKEFLTYTNSSDHLIHFLGLC
jgi:hypothetical protein